MVPVVPPLGVAEDHARPLPVEVAPLEAPLLEESFHRNEGELLGTIEPDRNGGWNPELEPVEGEPRDEASDLAIGLVLRTKVGVVVEFRIPTLLRDFDDAIDPFTDIAPEFLEGERLGKDPGHTDDRDRLPVRWKLHQFSSSWSKQEIVLDSNGFHRLAIRLRGSSTNETRSKVRFRTPRESPGRFRCAPPPSGKKTVVPGE